MKKIEEQMSFEFNSGEEESEKEEEMAKVGSDKKEKQKDKKREKEKRPENRIKVKSVERAEDELTGEPCYRIVLFWEVIQQPIIFLYYPKDNKVRWTLKPDFYISKKWWKKLVERARAVGKDYYEREKKKEEKK